MFRIYWLFFEDILVSFWFTGIILRSVVSLLTSGEKYCLEIYSLKRTEDTFHFVERIFFASTFFILLRFHFKANPKLGKTFL